MLDFIKASTQVFDSSYILGNEKLGMSGNYKTATGEISNEYNRDIFKGEYKGLKIKLIKRKEDSDRLIIQGSIHKFCNRGRHNYDDFSINDINSVIDDLCSELKIKSNLIHIHNLEIGVNVQVKPNSNFILLGLMDHKKSPFEKISIRSSMYFQAVHANYLIKAYDKGKQYNLNQQDLIRFELKYLKMFDLQNLLSNQNLIESKRSILLSDLSRPKVLRKFGELLCQRWSECTFYDFALEDRISKKDLKVNCLEWRNPRNWQTWNKHKRYQERKKLQKTIVIS